MLITNKKDFYKKPMAKTDLPLLEKDDFKLSFFEFWSPTIFYFPMKIYTAYLAIKYRGLTTATLANPKIYAGGFVGESKKQILSLVPEESKKYFADYKTFKKGNTPKTNFPIVAKPDQGERGAGVQIIFNDEELSNYVENFPGGETIFLQDLYDYPAEAGLFYIRKPDEENGKIFSLTLKYFPTITGDGKSSVRQLILQNPRAGKIADLYFKKHKNYLEEIMPSGEQLRLAFAGSHSQGAIFKNGNKFITEKMEKAWDELAKTIPELYFCRFDVRFHNMADLENLENLKIIEINGAGAEATHIWDSNTSLWQAYKTLMKQYKTMFEIGLMNKKKGYKPFSILELRKVIVKNKALKNKFPTTY